MIQEDYMEEWESQVQIHGFYKNYAVIALKVLLRSLNDSRTFHKIVGFSDHKIKKIRSDLNLAKLRRKIKKRTWDREYYLKNRDKILARIYSKRNRNRAEYLENLSRYGIEYRKRNKNAIREKKRRYAEKHREELKIKLKQWKENNPEKYREYQRKYREKLKARKEQNA